MIVLEPIAPANALIFKTIRLRVLETDPTAFGSTFAKEAKISDEEWLQRSVRWGGNGFINYLAREGDQARGLIGGYTEENNPKRARVVSMWVDPAYHRAGVGAMLIDGLRRRQPPVPCTSSF
jgi:GNAT superfamily N-acetyltransferase